MSKDVSKFHRRIKFCLCEDICSIFIGKIRFIQEKVSFGRTFFFIDLELNPFCVISVQLFLLSWPLYLISEPSGFQDLVFVKENVDSGG